MTSHEEKDFELLLRKTKLAKPPPAFTAQLLAAVAVAKDPAQVPQSLPLLTGYWRLFPRLLRWLVPAAAVGLVVAMVWRRAEPLVGGPANEFSSPQTSNSAAPFLTADEVKIDQQLVSSFDAVARLPSGEPVRFRCENWMDQVVLSDKAHGVIAANRQPRFEVVALRFETY